jgi:hypothetical protein
MPEGKEKTLRRLRLGNRWSVGPDSRKSMFFQLFLAGRELARELLPNPSESTIVIEIMVYIPVAPESFRK